MFNSVVCTNSIQYIRFLGSRCYMSLTSQIPGTKYTGHLQSSYDFAHFAHVSFWQSTDKYWPKESIRATSAWHKLNYLHSHCLGIGTWCGGFNINIHVTFDIQQQSAEPSDRHRGAEIKASEVIRGHGILKCWNSLCEECYVVKSVNKMPFKLPVSGRPYSGLLCFDDSREFRRKKN